MRVRKRFLLMLGVVVTLWLLANFDWHRGEPSSSGRCWCSWLEDYGRLPVNPRVYDKALLEMGSNAIPYLLRWIRYEEPGWRDAAGRLESKLRAILGKPATPVGWFDDVERERRADAAAGALIVLGQQVKPAVPDLIRLMNDTRRVGGARRAEEVLAGLERGGVSTFQERLTNAQAFVRLSCLEHISTLNSSTRQYFVKALSDSDVDIRKLAKGGRS